MLAMYTYLEKISASRMTSAVLARRGVTWSRWGDGSPLYPGPDLHEQRDADHRRDGEPADTCLAARQHDERRQQRTERGAGIATDLKQRLREPVATAGGQPRDPRRLRVKDGRAD